MTSGPPPAAERESPDPEGATEQDLYDIADWEPRTSLDRIAVGVYRLLTGAVRVTVIGAALLILLSQIVLGGLGAVVVQEPFVLLLIGLSAVPAVAIAAYIRYGDVSREPAGLIVGTFVLAVLFASFAAVINTAVSGAFGVGSSLLVIPFYFLVVGPVEESVKLLAVRLHAYRNASFNAVVDGAVYGAFAGLGFATIENGIYIGQQYLNTATTTGPPLVNAASTAAARTLAGPGHVLYSGFAGYYLGLAKFNPDNAGPIVVKGLLIAAVIHATYNSLVGIAPGLIAGLLGVGTAVATVGFILGYNAIVGLALFRKIARYRSAYRSLRAADAAPPEMTEFDG